MTNYNNSSMLIGVREHQYQSTSKTAFLWLVERGGMTAKFLVTLELRIQRAVPTTIWTYSSPLDNIKIIPHLDLHSCDGREAEEKMPRISVSTHCTNTAFRWLQDSWHKEAVPVKTQTNSNMLIRIRQHQNHPTSRIKFSWIELAEEKMLHQKLSESHTTFCNFQTGDTRDYPNKDT